MQMTSQDLDTRVIQLAYELRNHPLFWSVVKVPKRYEHLNLPRFVVFALYMQRCVM